MAEQVRPAPYPADTRAKGWRFELDLEQVIQSDTWVLASPEIRPWLLMLWTTAWQQVPCGSMPSDDALIVARLGIAPKVYTKARGVLLRGWWLADDGRLYHDTIASRVQDMLLRKGGERQRKADYRARKEAELKLAEANAHAQSSHDVPPMSRGTDMGRTRESHGSDATGTGTGTGTGLDSSYPPPSREVDEKPLSHGTDAGRICKAMRQQGIADGNPSSQSLRTLIDAGATEGEFVAAARKAADEQKGFGYALSIVANERKRAALLAQQVHRGAMPVAETAYQRSMRERMQEAAPESARKDPSHPAHAAEFFNAIEVPTRTVERIA